MSSVSQSRRRVHIGVIAAVVALVALFGIAAAIVAAHPLAPASAVASPSASSAPEKEYDDSVDDVILLGETGRNHFGIAYTVTSVDWDGLTKVHDGKSTQLADGEFCTVAVDIANETTKPSLFWETYAAAAAGVGEWLYRVDSVATLWNGKSTAYAEPIAAGASISTELVFDVPYGETIDYFQFGQAVVEGLVLDDTSAQYTAGS